MWMQAWKSWLSTWVKYANTTINSYSLMISIHLHLVCPSHQISSSTTLPSARWSMAFVLSSLPRRALWLQLVLRVCLRVRICKGLFLAILTMPRWAFSGSITPLVMLTLIFSTRKSTKSTTASTSVTLTSLRSSSNTTMAMHINICLVIRQFVRPALHSQYARSVGLAISCS